MNIQHRLGHVPPPTVIDHIEDEEKHLPKDDDLDRGQASHVENSIQRSYPGINRDAERAVIRKLDLRVPTLLGVLCWFH